MSSWLTRPVVLVLAAIAAPSAWAQADPDRLGRDVVPTFESVRLVVDPAKVDYFGSVQVDLKVARPTATFSFHAEGPVVSSLTLKGEAGEIALRQTVGPHGLVRAEASRPLAAGAYTLDLEFKARFGTQAVGLYRTVVREQSYLFTQFEADEARTAFPCWDEPSFKIPYQITVVVPEGVIAVSNTPVESETSVGLSAGDRLQADAPAPFVPARRGGWTVRYRAHHRLVCPGACGDREGLRRPGRRGRARHARPCSPLSSATSAGPIRSRSSTSSRLPSSSRARWRTRARSPSGNRSCS